MRMRTLLKSAIDSGFPEGEADVALLRRDLVRLARLQLGDAEMAEDAVQEAFAAALAAWDRFERRSTFRTWIFSILRNKVYDLLRQRRGKQRFEPTESELRSDDFDPLFSNVTGHWNPEDRPTDWGDPERHLESQQFRAVLQECLERLPPATAQVFMLRELFGLEFEEICKECSISSSNCWVMLYRARMALRLCLQASWFQERKL